MATKRALKEEIIGRKHSFKTCGVCGKVRAKQNVNMQAVGLECCNDNSSNSNANSNNIIFTS